MLIALLAIGAPIAGIVGGIAAGTWFKRHYSRLPASERRSRLLRLNRRAERGNRFMDKVMAGMVLGTGVLSVLILVLVGGAYAVTHL